METKSPAPSRTPFFRRCARAVFSRKAAYGLLILITLVALLYAFENFRGARAWKQYQQEAAARGLKLDFASQVPPEVPDEENGALQPWIMSWFPKPAPGDDGMWPDHFQKASQRIKSRKREEGWLPKDLVAWQKAFADQETQGGRSERLREQPRTPAEQAESAPAVLQALAVYDSALEQFRAAAQKPRVRYPVHYNLEQPFAILLPHLAKLKSVTTVLGLRVSAQLALSRTNEAFNDVLLMLWVCESLREENLLINQLVRIACFRLTAHTIWEGLAAGKWSGAQLRTIQERVQQIDFISNIHRAASAERAGAVAAIEWIRKNGQFGASFSGPEDPPEFRASEQVIHRMPRGWYRLETVNLCRLLDGQIEGVVDQQRRTINAERLEANNRTLMESFQGTFSILWRHRLFAKLLLPALEQTTRKFATAQTIAHQVVMACALERYRLANGGYPEKLEALVPTFLQRLPHDVLTGEPLSYERESEREFVLRSSPWPSDETVGAKRRAAEFAQDTTWTSGGR
jgi:hypothetical protein